MRLHNTFFRALCNFFRAIRSPPPPPPPKSKGARTPMGRDLGIGYQYLDFSAHFYGGGLFLRRRLISTGEAHFYGRGSFLRRRLISTEEVYFYGGGLFLRRRLISTEEAHFYRGGSFLRRRLISTEEAYLYGGGSFLRRKHISTVFCTQRGSALQLHLAYENSRPSSLSARVAHSGRERRRTAVFAVYFTHRMTILGFTLEAKLVSSKDLTQVHLKVSSRSLENLPSHLMTEYVT